MADGQNLNLFFFLKMPVNDAVVENKNFPVFFLREFFHPMSGSGEGLKTSESLKKGLINDLKRLRGFFREITVDLDQVFFGATGKVDFYFFPGHRRV